MNFKHALQDIVRPTTLIEARQLSAHLRAKVLIASETFQHTGSFKFRAAYNAAANVSQSELFTASSGNFGQALAYACRLLGKSCTVVMPHNSASVKIAAVRASGGIVDLIDVAVTSRQERVDAIARERPNAYFASAYDDLLVIRGNASLGVELAALDGQIDAIVAPVGGGGLTAGIVQGLRDCGKSIPVIGAEPLLGNDAARSLRAGCIVTNTTEPKTIADGARTVSLGARNWEILREGLSAIVEVPEKEIIETVRLLFHLANLKVEPTGALAVAALLTDPERFRGRSVCCVASGGNVDPQVYRSILEG